MVATDKERYVLELKRKLRKLGMPAMELTCNFHDDNDLTVFYFNLSNIMSS